MSVRIECDGTIKTFKGDQCNFKIDGFPSEDDYTAYFAVRDENGNQIGSQYAYELNREDSIDVKLPPEFTELFEVPEGMDYVVCYWAVKISSKAKGENTLQLFRNSFGQKLKFIVYDKRVEGPHGTIELS